MIIPALTAVLRSDSLIDLGSFNLTLSGDNGP